MHKLTKKNIRKNRKTKIYNLDGGSIASAKKYFNTNFISIIDKLKTEPEFLKINSDNIYNNNSFKTISNRYKKNETKLKDIKDGKNHVNEIVNINNFQEKINNMSMTKNSIISRMKNNDTNIKTIKEQIFNLIKNKLILMTKDFFYNLFNGTGETIGQIVLKNSYTDIKKVEDKDEFFKCMDKDYDFINKFTNIENINTEQDRDLFVDEYIEWILSCYNQGNLKLYETIPDDNLFKNYENFLKLYTQVRLLVKNASKLKELKKNDVEIELQRKLVTDGEIDRNTPFDVVNQKVDDLKKQDNPIVRQIIKDVMDKYKTVDQHLRTNNILGSKIPQIRELAPESELASASASALASASASASAPKPEKQFDPEIVKIRSQITLIQNELQLLNDLKKQNKLTKLNENKITDLQNEKRNLTDQIKQITQLKTTTIEKPTQISKNIVIPYFETLSQLNNFCNSYQAEIKNIKSNLINIQVKLYAKGPEHVEIILKTDTLYVYKVLTKGGAMAYGSQTQWCTATTSSNNMFDYYNSKGYIYIIQKRDLELESRALESTALESSQNNTSPKIIDVDDYNLQKSKTKFQLQIETKQLKNIEDADVTIEFVNNNFNDAELALFLDNLTKDIFEYDHELEKLTITCNLFSNFIDKTSEKYQEIKRKLDEYISIDELVLINFNYTIDDLLDKLTKLTRLNLGTYKGSVIEVNNKKITDLNKINIKVLHKIKTLTMELHDEISYYDFFVKLIALKLLNINKYTHKHLDEIEEFTKNHIRRIDHHKLHINFYDKTLSYYENYILNEILEAYQKRSKKNYINMPINWENNNYNSRESTYNTNTNTNTNPINTYNNNNIPPVVATKKFILNKSNLNNSSSTNNENNIYPKSNPNSNPNTKTNPKSNLRPIKFITRNYTKTKYTPRYLKHRNKTRRNSIIFTSEA